MQQREKHLLISLAFASVKSHQWYSVETQCLEVRKSDFYLRKNASMLVLLMLVLTGQIFRIGTVLYAEGLWRMRRHGPVIARCTDSEDFPLTISNHAPFSTEM